MRVVLYIGLFFTFTSAGAAIPKQLRTGYSPVTEKKNYIVEGAFIGGKGAKTSSLLNVKLLKSTAKSAKSQRERIYFQTGNADGNLSKETGYFHISVEKNPARIVLDFSNLQRTAIGPKELKAALEGSGFVKNAEITMDPVDHSTNVTLNLYTANPVAAFFRPNRPGRVYLEIQGGAAQK